MSDSPKRQPPFRSRAAQTVIALIAVALAVLVASSFAFRARPSDDSSPPGVVSILEDELELRPAEIQFLQGRERWIGSLRPSDRAQRLTRFIKPEAKPYAQGLKAFALGQFDEARRIFGGVRPDNEFDALRLARARSALELMTGQFNAAVDLLRDAIERWPDETRFFNDLGYAYVRLGEFERARAAFDEATKAAAREDLTSGKNAVVAWSNLGTVHDALGQLDKAIAASRRAIDLADAALDESERMRQNVRVGLAQYLERNGEFDEAMRLYDGVLEARKGYTGIYGADTEFLRANVNATRGDYRAAVEAFEKGLAVLREDFYGDHPVYPERLLQFSSHCEMAGDFVRAEAACGEAIERIGDRLGTDHPFYASAVFRMGELRDAQGRLEEARMLMEQAMTLRREAYAGAHPEIAAGLSRLGTLNASLARFDDADRCLGESLAMSEALYGADNRVCTMLKSQLADVHRARGDFAAARGIYAEAVETAREAFGSNTMQTAYHLFRLGMIEQAMGFFDAAGGRYDEACAIVRNAFGEDHPNYIGFYVARASLDRDAGRYAEAEQRYNMLLESASRVFGPDHLNIAYLTNNYALLAESQGDYETAKARFENAIEISRAALGDRHLIYARLLRNLGRAERVLGEIDAAKAHYEQAAAINRTIGTELHPAYAVHLTSAAAVYVASGELDQARAMYENALRAGEKSLGPEHLDTSWILREFAACLRMLGEDALAAEYDARAEAIETAYAPAKSYAHESYIGLQLAPW